MDYYKKSNPFKTKNDIYCMVIDTDRWGKNLKLAVDDARQRGYLVALSNPCFEIWLLMHFQDADTILKKANVLKTKKDINIIIHSKNICGITITGKNEIDYFPRTDSAVRTAEKLDPKPQQRLLPVSYTHLRAHETPEHLVCRLLLEKKKRNQQKRISPLRSRSNDLNRCKWWITLHQP